MWVAIWWQWVCGCFDSLSQIGRKFWFSFEFLLWVSVHLQCLWLSFSGRCFVGLLERQREKGGEKRKIGKKRKCKIDGKIDKLSCISCKIDGKIDKVSFENVK